MSTGNVWKPLKYLSAKKSMHIITGMSDPGARRTPRATCRSAQTPLMEPGRKNCIFVVHCYKSRCKAAAPSREECCNSLLKKVETHLKNAAAIQEDAIIPIAVGSRDLIAREVHCQKQCYNEYPRELSLSVRRSA